MAGIAAARIELRQHRFQHHLDPADADDARRAVLHGHGTDRSDERVQLANVTSADKPQATHSCHRKECINPDHLRWGSAKDNAADYQSTL